jgi:hypothetical protein
MVVYRQGPNPKHCVAQLLVIEWANFLRTALILCPAVPRSGKATFSEMSSMQLYHIHPLYAYTKSYSKEEVKRFLMDILMEAARIKTLVLLT